jgi:hypothetical protein
MTIKRQSEPPNAPPTRTLSVESSGGIVVDGETESCRTARIVVEENEREDPKLRLSLCITSDGEAMVPIEEYF